jgi:hypothetical protein
MKKILNSLFCGFLILNIIAITGFSSGLFSKPDKQVWNFDKDKVGGLPAGWKKAETNGKGQLARWQIVKDGAKSGRQSLAITETKNTGSTYNLIAVEGTNYKDLEFSVWVKAISGKEDQGGGPIWRVKDANNYYIARWNPLEENFRLYVVQNGQRKQLADRKVSIEPKVWRKITISHKNDKISAYIDNKIDIYATDGTFENAGMIGLWTKADAATAFDSIEVKNLPAN